MAKLGSKKHPAIIRVATKERARDLVFLCKAKGWEVIAGIEPDEPEDITDMERLIESSAAAQLKTAPVGPPTFVNQNEPCPCNSGRKYKNCCGK